MAENTKTIAISTRATEIVESLIDRGYFKDGLSAMKFGMAYALKKHRNELSDQYLKELISTYDSKGSSYNTGTVDPDKCIERIIVAFYPECDSPYAYARALICFGLNKIDDQLQSGRITHISELM